ncbi:MAG: hypothetical protein P8Y03_17070 [Anaerolineales bacterium]
MRLESPFGRITLRVQFHPESTQAGSTPAHKACLIRAGELVYGTGTVSPVLGWVSRNYGYKEPALSFSVETESRLPLTVITEWDFP